MKKIAYGIVILFLTIGVSLAANYLVTGQNWDANVPDSQESNDNWTLSGRLDIEDSETSDYLSGKRGEISGLIISDLFGNFYLDQNIILNISEKNVSDLCSDEAFEVFDISGGEINSDFWGEINIDYDNSYFCSNQEINLKLHSDSLGYKDVGGIPTNTEDVFGKQEISINGITSLNNDGELDISSRGDDEISSIYVADTSLTYTKSIINKNISTLTSNFELSTENLSTILEFNSGDDNEKFYYFDNINSENIIYLGEKEYINKGKNIQIGNSGLNKIRIVGKNTVIAENSNIYIKSNLYNSDKTSALVLIATRDSISGKGGNIYIDPEVTNIDAILIADGSLLSLYSDDIQSLADSSQKNNLRRQLFIYGSVLSSNTVGSDEIPYGADYYESEEYPDGTMSDNVYDLANLRFFNLNYGKAGTTCDDENKLVPIDGNGGYLTNAWAGRKQCYNDDSVESGLRGTDKINPVIIEYNPSIQNLGLSILSNN